MRPATELSADGAEFLRILIRTKVDFLLIGAHALAANGVPRATDDMDVFVDAVPENAKRVFAALAEFGAPLGAHGVTVKDFARPRFYYQMGLPPNRIDVITTIEGVLYAEARASRIWFEIDGLALPTLGPETYLKNKRAAGRPKDLGDVYMLEGLRKRLDSKR